ncbi:MAG: DUF4089 domain-containing protein [Leptolyngbyaceae cyanobacterium]
MDLASSAARREFDPQIYVRQMRDLLEIPLPPSTFAGVTQEFERVVAIAQSVLDFELADEIESAPTFYP